ncbi:MAG: hypothetical protein IJC57_02815 [Clostridia bacterium]|nr:hypothetical protein [Clostridia bacterium]
MKRIKIFPVLLIFFCSMFCLTNTIIAGPTTMNGIGGCPTIMQQGTSGKWSWAACAQYAIYRMLIEVTSAVDDEEEFTKLIQKELDDTEVYYDCDDSTFQRAILKRFGRDEQSGDTRIFGNWLTNLVNRLLKTKHFAFELNKGFKQISELFNTKGNSDDNLWWMISVDCKGKGTHHVFLNTIGGIGGEVHYYDPYDGKSHVMEREDVESMSVGGPSILTKAYYGHTDKAKILTISGFRNVE